jgi:hypothetical protein
MAYKSKETLQAYQKRYREQHREQTHEYLHDWRLKRRAWAEEQLGGKCVRCGSTENLQFDHIDPATKTQAISRMWGSAEALLLAELQKCQLLCKPCHQAKTSEIGWSKAEHGSESMYGYHHCRCEVCVAARRLYLRNRYHAKKAEKAASQPSA